MQGETVPKDNTKREKKKTLTSMCIMEGSIAEVPDEMYIYC